MSYIDQFLIGSTAAVRDAMALIEQNARGIALVVNEDRTLLGTITDGDLRRAVLAGTDLDEPVTLLLSQRPKGRQKPLTASLGTPGADLIHLMSVNSVRHIPLVDEQGRVADLVVLTDLIREYGLPLTAVVMAGGYGRRLAPLTEDTPKPMLQVAGRPLLERIIEQLREAGIRKVNITTHYKHEVIEKHFGDGGNFGVTIQYTQENRPLGTAGSLRFMKASSEPLLIINGDILTRIDFRAMLDFHRDHEAEMTVAVRPREIQIPYGVVETNGVFVIKIQEKPKLRQFVNAGVYVASPGVCRYVPADGPFDMPDLINRLLAENKRVIGFPVQEYWRDVGQMEEYIGAAMDVSSGAY